MLRVRNGSVPMVGFTCHSLTDQVDWNTALRENNNLLNPLLMRYLYHENPPRGRSL